MIQIGKTTLSLILILLVTSCGPTSLNEIRMEGEAQTKKLACELQRIETKEDLEKAIPFLKKRFNKIADLLVLIQENPKEEFPPSEASEALFIELARIYEMPKGKELIEIAQVEAIYKLEKGLLKPSLK